MGSRNGPGPDRERAAIQAAVGIVGAITAVISYGHIELVARRWGQSWLDAHLLPLSVDGLIVVASLVLLRQIRHGEKDLRLAQSMLILGCLATVAANVASGWAGGWGDRALSALPAVTFIGCAEMLISKVRRFAGPARDPGVPPVPGDVEEAAELALRASVAGGNPLSQRQLMTRFGLTRGQETSLRQRVEGKERDDLVGGNRRGRAGGRGGDLGGAGAAAGQGPELVGAGAAANGQAGVGR